MGHNEITELRKSGKLEEALNLALREYKSNPNDTYIASALAWVYRDLLNQICNVDDFKKSLSIFNKCLDLNLFFIQQTLLVDKLKWCINNLGWKLIQYDGDKSLELRQLLEIAVKLPVFKNSANSILINMFRRAFKEKRDDYFRLVDWQGFDNFIETEDQKDFSSQLSNGQRMPSLVENYFGTYAKHLLPYQMNGQLIFMKERVNEFLPLIESLRENHPNYNWIPYHQAKLENAIGNRKKAIDILIPFVRSHKNDYWAWGQLGDFLEDSDEKLSCYAKGLQCRSEAKKIIKMREKIIPFFITRKDYSAAKFEIEEIRKVRHKNEWRISPQIIGWQREPWYLNTNANQDNYSIYKKYSLNAEDLLFGDLPEAESKNGIILWKDIGKQIAGFLLEDAPTDIEKSGVLKGDYVERLRIYETYSFQIYDNKGRLEVITEPTPIDNADLRNTFVQEVQGTLRLAGNDFGFITDAFIPQRLIEKFQLHDGDPFSGKKVKSWNRKKGEWGWSIFDDSD